MLQVVHHQRIARKGQVSIERLFSEIRVFLTNSWIVRAEVCRFPSKGLWPRLANLWHARKQCADIHHIVGDVHYLAFCLSRDRIVLTIHDCATLNRLSGWKQKLLLYFWFTGPMRRASVVTTISQETKDELRKWVGDLADKVVVVPNLVRSEFTPDSKAFCDKQPVCLQVGTGWNKNVERVAEALVGTPCRLEIVGVLSQVQRARLEDLKVSFKELGRLSDEELVGAYRGCDFVVFASIYEGFGLPILEAQATGRPVITSARSSMPEAAGDGALFVDPESVNSIREAVEKIVFEPELREDLISRGFRNVSSYRPEVISQMYSDLYQRVVDKNV